MSSLALLFLLHLAPVQEDTVTFQRVHLRNGNFIDGTLLDQTEKHVVLEFKFGTITFKRIDIDKIEHITMRSLEEKAPEVPKPVKEPIKKNPVKIDDPTKVRGRRQEEPGLAEHVLHGDGLDFDRRDVGADAAAVVDDEEADGEYAGTAELMVAEREAAGRSLEERR